jgi:hypothetical protein
MSQTDFTVWVFQNEYLPERGREVNAIATVTSSGVLEGSSAPVTGSEIIIIDCSGSMSAPRDDPRHAFGQATASTWAPGR